MQTPTATKVSTLTLKEQQTSGLHLLKKSCKKKKIKGSSTLVYHFNNLNLRNTLKIWLLSCSDLNKKTDYELSLS